MEGKSDYTMYLCFLKILEGIIPTLYIGNIKLIIDTVVLESGAGQKTLKRIIYYLLLLFAIRLFSNLIKYTTSFIQTSLGDIVSNTINMMIMKKSTSLDLYHFEHPEFHDMLNRAHRGVTYKPFVIISTIFGSIRNGIAIFSFIFRRG